MTADDNSDPRASFRRGVRDGMPYAVAGALVAMTFGVIGHDAGMSALETIAMSAIVFAGSAQFAAVTIVAGGGSLLAAVIAATMMNSRFLPMGIALAPSLPGRALTRALQGQTIVDASWAIAARPDGTFDRHRLFGATAPQYVTWVGGTAVGAYAGNVLDTEALGLDAIFPAFFACLLIAELRQRGSAGSIAAAAGAAIALALTPFIPAGLPVLAAAAGALAGVRVAPMMGVSERSAGGNGR